MFFGSSSGKQGVLRKVFRNASDFARDCFGFCLGLIRKFYHVSSEVLRHFFDNASVLTEELPNNSRIKGGKRAKNSRMISDEYSKNTQRISEALSVNLSAFSLLFGIGQVSSKVQYLPMDFRTG
jgi:hypothetical protein